MGEFLTEILAYPTVIWTVLLSVCLFYWITVILGGLGVDFIDLDLDADESPTVWPMGSRTESRMGSPTASPRPEPRLRPRPQRRVSPTVRQKAPRGPRRSARWRGSSTQ